MVLEHREESGDGSELVWTVGVRGNDGSGREFSMTIMADQLSEEDLDDDDDDDDSCKLRITRPCR